MKKLLISILTSLILLLSLAPFFQAKAQSTWYNQNPFEWYIKVYDENTSPPSEIFGERYTAAQVQWVFWSLFSTLFNLPFTFLGMPPSPSVCVAHLALGNVSIDTCANSIIDFITAVSTKMKDLIALNNNGLNSELVQSPNQNSIWKKIFLEDRPISGISYLRNFGRKLKIVPEASAAESFGYNKLTIVRDFWTLSRNLAYFFFVLAIIIVSFMIMFKVKISPQAVITVQSALPKIIISLILVTFSFAIAGFMIDIMYVIMGIFSLILSISGLEGFGGNPAVIFAIIDGFGTGGLAILVYLAIFLILYVVAVFLAFMSALLSLGYAGVLFSLILGIFTIVLSIILVINFFRIIFALFKALAGFYLAVIIGPFQLALGVLPQSQNTLGSWIKSLISKLAVFPATGILFFIAISFLIKSIQVSSLGLVDGNKIVGVLRPILDKFGWSDLFSIDASSLWGPPMLHNPMSATSIAFILIALGCIMLIPKVQKAIESALAGRPFDFETGFGEATGMAKGGAGAAAGYVGEYNELKYKASGGTAKGAGRLAAASHALQQLLRM